MVILYLLVLFSTVSSRPSDSQTSQISTSSIGSNQNSNSFFPKRHPPFVDTSTTPAHLPDFLDHEHSAVAPPNLGVALESMLPKETCKKFPLILNVTSSYGECFSNYTTHSCVGLCASLFAPRQTSLSGSNDAALQNSDITICQSCSPIFKLVRLSLKCKNGSEVQSTRVRIVESCSCAACSTFI